MIDPNLADTLVIVILNLIIGWCIADILRMVIKWLMKRR